MIWGAQGSAPAPEWQDLHPPPKLHTQGSDTIDHWKLNLTFDPVPFENPALGIKVRAGTRVLGFLGF